jgi:hypothetical protein
LKGSLLLEFVSELDGQVYRNRRGAHPAFRARDRDQALGAPLLRSGSFRDKTFQRLAEHFRGHRLAQEFLNPAPHRLKQELRVRFRLRGAGNDAHRRLQSADVPRQSEIRIRIASQVQQNDFGQDLARLGQIFSRNLPLEHVTDQSGLLERGPELLTAVKVSACNENPQHGLFCLTIPRSRSGIAPLTTLAVPIWGPVAAMS